MTDNLKSKNDPMTQLWFKQNLKQQIHAKIKPVQILL